MERAVVLLVGEYVIERELPPTIGGQEAEAPAASRLDFANMTLEEIERLAVMDTLGAGGRQQERAARRLGINRKTTLLSEDWETGEIARTGDESEEQVSLSCAFTQPDFCT